MNTQIKLLGISGSLRKGSYNTSLLKAASQLLPQDVSMDTFYLGDIPLYNADLDKPSASQRPPVVQEFRDMMTKADGLVICSPEYNYGIPGLLKNAIDWASRGEDSPLIGKPVAVMGATISLWGTVRMQLVFQNIFLYLNMKPVYKPEVLIAQAGNKFDDKGNLTDSTSLDLVRKKLEALKKLILHEREALVS
ncbi:NADPH-dependent FMN reductase [Longitalea luteola]|uniref:NADPH-dependent FMN reductase n=1 Tax=Longitalea luteola TaxID=2812563 RepID=UPI001A979516|nr:NAD(P)H-dependent oxidoreductase [Longitalea luteola]